MVFPLGNIMTSLRVLCTLALLSGIAALKATLAGKTALANNIRAHLSWLQRRRFDHTYGKDDLGFLSFLAAATAGK